MNLKYIIQTIMFGAALFAGVHCAAHEGAVSVHPDARPVEHVLKAQFDKPEAPLSVAPVSVEGNYAVAGWLQGSRGGRALLRKDAGGWTILACGGDGLSQASALQQAGMSVAAAASLAQKIERQEAQLTVAQRKQLSSFVGVMKLEHGAHPHH